jgi:kinetochore protein Spc25, fungi type
MARGETAHAAAAPLKTSYSRPLHLQAILNQPNPRIDLKVEEFEATTKAFTAAVQDYVTRAKEEINKRKELHTQQLRKEAERRKVMEAEITDAKMREIELMKGSSPP